MIRVGFNLFRVTPQSGGIRHYAEWLIRHAAAFGDEFELTLFTYPATAWPAELAGLAQVVCLDKPKQLPRHARELDVIYHFGRQPYPAVPCGAIAFIPDCLEQHHPGYFSRKDLKAREHEYECAAAHCDLVVTPSHFSRDDLARRTACCAESIRVVPHHAALERTAAPLPDASAVASRYLLYPANNWPHKNYDRLLEALRIVRDRGMTGQLVLTGHVDARFPHPIDTARRLGLADQVVHLGHVPGPQLRWLYDHATALVFPSLHEGFGLPMLEAFESRLPVACAEAGSLPEITGDAALRFAPDNPTAMADAMIRVLEDKSLRAELVVRGEARLAAFARESILNLHAAVFREAANRA